MLAGLALGFVLAGGPGEDRAAGGTVYRYRDANGARTYTNVPPNEEVAGRLDTYDEIVPVPAPPGEAPLPQESGRKVVRPVTAVHRGIALFRNQGRIGGDLRRLDRLIQAAGRRVPPQAPATHAGAQRLLETIAGLIDTEAPDFTAYISSQDCRRSMLFAAVGEALGLPISLAAVPGHLLVHYRLPDGEAVLWEATVGQILPEAFYRERYDLTAESLGRGGFLLPLPPEAVLARFYRERGDLAKQEGRFAAAEADYSGSIDLYDGDYVAFIHRGSARAHLRRDPEALADFRRALGIHPDEPAAHYNMASLLARKRKYSQALIRLEEALRIDPDYQKAIDLQHRIRSGG